MAIVNGKRLYNSDKLDAVAREDDRAAAEYAWLMAGIADDFGRFRVSPRRILGKAYDRRPSVNELLVADWLALFEKHELLRLYAVGGATFAEWVKYMGDPPSQRHYHACPEPPWSDHKHSKACKFRDDAAPTTKGRKTPTPTPTKEDRQEGSPNTYPQGSPPFRSVPAVPSVPSDTSTASSQPRGDPPPCDEPRNVRAPNPIIGPGDADRLCVEGWRLVRAIAAAAGIGPESVIAQASTGRGKYKGSPKARFENMEHDRLILTVEDLRTWARECGAIEAPPVPVSLEKPASETADYDRRDALAAEFVAWLRLNPEAATFGGRTGMHGVAFGSWAKSKGLADWVRAAVLPIVTGLLAPEPVDPAKEHAFSDEGAARTKSGRVPLCSWCAKRREDPVHVQAVLA